MKNRLETKLQRTRQSMRRIRLSRPRKYTPIERFPMRNMHVYLSKDCLRERGETPDYKGC
jgi:hypothetical protein